MFKFINKVISFILNWKSLGLSGSRLLSVAFFNLSPPDQSEIALVPSGQSNLVPDVCANWLLELDSNCLLLDGNDSSSEGLGTDVDHEDF